MPRIELSASKGLVQAAGQGFIDKDFQTHTDVSVDLTSSPTAAQKGALIHLVTATDDRSFKLPATADSTAGQIKFVIATSVAANTAITVKNHSNDTIVATLSSTGDFAICVFDGTNWVAGESLA